jgi:hypothetical protein
MQQLYEWWQGKKELVATLPTPMQNELNKVYTDTMARLPDDPARQAP